MTRARAPGERVFRALLYAYPREFRRRYASDMLEFYRERIAMTGGSPRGVAAAWLHVVPDLLVSALAERFASLHRELDPAPKVVQQFAHRREDHMSILLQDIRYALRGIRQRPGFAAVILATLALGIGANAAIFTVVNAVLLRPLPFANSERLIDLSHGDDGVGSTVSEPEFVDYQHGVTALSRLAAYSGASVMLTVPDGDPTLVVSTRVSRDFFDVLGVKAEIGRVFTPDEFSPTSKARLVVISHGLWVQQYAGDRRIVGRTLTINGAQGTIIGVMPAGFDFPEHETGLWTAWRMNPDSLWTRNNHYLNLVGRIAPNATLAQVRAQVRTLQLRWPHDFPETYPPNEPISRQASPLVDQVLGPTRPYLLALLGAVGFILMIACVNVANLLLARGETRRKELAIRTALGASRQRVARQMLTESSVLAVLGALFGVGLSWFGTRVLAALAPADLPRVDQINVDARVVAFTVAVTIITAFAFGLVPAVRAWRGDAADSLRDEGRTSAQGQSRFARRALVVTEVALAVVMLSGAGLLVRSLIKLQSIDLGFDPSRVLSVRVTLPSAKYNDTTADEYYRQLLGRAARIPGVASIAAVSYLPISGSDNSWSIMLDGRVLQSISESPDARPENVTPEYFRAMRIRVLRGRVFTDQDRMGAPPVAVISEGMAKRLWPNVDPIGHTLKMFNPTAPWVTIVGVVADVRARGFQREAPMTMYFPYSQSAASAYVQPRRMTIVARAARDPAALATPLRRIARELDRSAAVSDVLSLDQVVGDSIASRRFATALLGGFAALALVLAGIGIYGVISYGVSQRRHEIGVRLAMGASSVSIIRLVAGEGGGMTAAGLAFGLAGASATQALLRSVLVGVRGTDLVTLVGVMTALLIVACVACAMPIWRATSVSPTEVLRTG
jgi:putative ABC transport system permease protein